MDFTTYFKDPFKTITIAVIGAGGTGSQFLAALARIVYAIQEMKGIRFEVTVYDPDTVELANVGRQLFSLCEIGMYKSEVIVSKINRTYGFAWEAKYHAFELGYTLKGKNLNENNRHVIQNRSSNFIITCVDNVDSRRMVNRIYNDAREWYRKQNDENYIYAYPFVWIDIGNTLNTGNVIIKSDVSKGLFEHFPDLVDNEKGGPSCSLAEALTKQDLFVNTFAANIAAKMLWDMLRNYEIRTGGAFFNLNTFKVNSIKI